MDGVYRERERDSWIRFRFIRVSLLIDLRVQLNFNFRLTFKDTIKELIHLKFKSLTLTQKPTSTSQSELVFYSQSISNLFFVSFVSFNSIIHQLTIHILSINQSKHKKKEEKKKKKKI